MLSRHGDAIAAAPRLRWIGYLSTTGVYGDRNGGWVDEDTEPAPMSDRSRRRLAAEVGWRRFADRCPVDVFRLAGIYGPGRSVFDDLRAGKARRIIKAGHAFGRIHRDDIVRAVLAAMRQERRVGRAHPEPGGRRTGGKRGRRGRGGAAAGGPAAGGSAVRTGG